MTTRGGTGNAYGVAMEDARNVSRVEWYTVPIDIGRVLSTFVQLPCHSILRITVGKGTTEEDYTIEKALPTEWQREDGRNIFYNGVYISWWKDVKPNITS